jgi:hypothetical protein
MNHERPHSQLTDQTPPPHNTVLTLASPHALFTHPISVFHKISIKGTKQYIIYLLKHKLRCVHAWSLVGRLERNSPLGKPSRRWENIKLDFKEVGGVAWAGSIWLRIQADSWRL